MAIDVERLYERRADKRWDRMVVGDILERMTWIEPDKVAFIAAPSALYDPAFARVTYRGADHAANQVANRLLGHGVERGERVALLCENSVEGLLIKFGIAKAGAVAMPINPMMAPDVVTHMLKFVGARHAIVDVALWKTGRACFEAAGVTPIAYVGDPTAMNGLAPGFSEWIAGASTAEPDVVLHSDDVWQILLTSGTTSMPKAVMITHTYSYMTGFSHAMTMTRGLRLENELRACSFLPIVFHVGDQAHLMSPLMCGGSLVVGRGVSPAAIARAVTDERVTCLWAGSPQFINDLVREIESKPGEYDVKSVTVLIYGWGMLDPVVAEKLQRLCDGVLLEGIFGQTEAVACHKFLPERWPETYRKHAPAVNYVGLPTPILGSTVLDTDNQPLVGKPGQPGEAVYRSPAMTAGYFRDEKATREAFRSGWFHSGDMCQYDEDGLRVMVDRIKDVVKSGGENVSSIRVEAVLAQHPAISRAAVVGLPHERWGEMVTAAVIAREGEGVDEQELIAFCRQRLAGFETPKKIVVLKEFPVTVGGKVLKYKLRQQLKA